MKCRLLPVNREFGSGAERIAQIIAENLAPTLLEGGIIHAIDDPARQAKWVSPVRRQLKSAYQSTSPLRSNPS
jgi:hypothetical protein